MIFKKSGHFGIIFLLMLLSRVDLMSQPGRIPLTQKYDSIQNHTGTSDNSLFGGTGYGTNMIYLGSTISQNLPFEFATLVYGFKNSLYASVSAIHLNGLNPFGAFYIGSVTYSHTFNSWLDISAGCYRYQVAPSLSDSLFNNFIYSDLTLGFDWRILYSRISIGGLFSQENNAYFQFRNSRYFQTPDFFHGKAYVSFDPFINLLFGSLIIAETDTETVYTYSQPGRKWKIKNHGHSTVINYTRKPGLLGVDIGVPVTLNTDFMAIEAEPDFILPGYNSPGYPGPKGFVFTLSAIFRIF